MTTRATQSNRTQRPDPNDDWEPSTGLPDDFDFWVTRAWFGFDEDYGGDIPLLIWEGESPDADLDRPIIWSLGRGWEPRDRGQSVIHEKRTRFVDVSQLGRLLKRIQDFPDLDMRERGSAREAKVWNGLGFHMMRETIKNPTGASERGIPQEYDHLMPVAFLGIQGEEDGGKRAGARARTAGRTTRPAPAARTQARNGAEEDDDGEEQPQPRRGRRSLSQPENAPEARSEDRLQRQLEARARAAASLEDFQRKALNLEGLEDRQDLYADVLDDGPEGLYARLTADA